MNCQKCDAKCKKHGKDRKGHQRYRCRECKTTFTARKPQPLGAMRIDPKRAETALNMLLEGMSIRAVERLTGLHRDTICDLVATVGDNCFRFLESTVQGVEVEDVQCDEVWSFVGCKEKTKQRLNRPEDSGDAYLWVGIERNTKLIVAWHLGKRSSEDAWEFVDKLYFATSGRFQISTDGYGAYTAAIPLIFNFNVDFSQLIKTYGKPGDGEERRYSPAKIIGVKSTVGCGSPDPDRICTSHVERSNLTLRMQVRRFTRLTNAHSKKWDNHEAMIALYVAWYNFCRPHSTLEGKTPAQENGLTDKRWSLGELLRAAA